MRRAAERRAGRQQQSRRPDLVAPIALHRVHFFIFQLTHRPRCRTCARPLRPRAMPCGSPAPAPRAAPGARSAPPSPNDPAPTPRSANGRWPAARPAPGAARIPCARSGPPFSSSTTSRPPCSAIFSPSVACRAYSTNATPTAASSSQANGSTSRAPCNQKTVPMPATPRTATRRASPAGRRDRAVALQEPVDALALKQWQNETRNSTRASSANQCVDCSERVFDDLGRGTMPGSSRSAGL